MILHSGVRYFTIVLNALVCRAKRIHSSDTCLSKVNWSSINKPNNFTQDVGFIVCPDMFRSISFTSFAFFTTKVWNFSGFTFIWLLSNHVKVISADISKFLLSSNISSGSSSSSSSLFSQRIQVKLYISTTHWIHTGINGKESRKSNAREWFHKGIMSR